MSKENSVPYYVSTPPPTFYQRPLTPKYSSKRNLHKKSTVGLTNNKCNSNNCSSSSERPQLNPNFIKANSYNYECSGNDGRMSLDEQNRSQDKPIMVKLQSSMSPSSRRNRQTSLKISEMKEEPSSHQSQGRNYTRLSQGNVSKYNSSMRTMQSISHDKQHAMKILPESHNYGYPSSQYHNVSFGEYLAALPSSDFITTQQNIQSSTNPKGISPSTADNLNKRSSLQSMDINPPGVAVFKPEVPPPSAFSHPPPISNVFGFAAPPMPSRTLPSLTTPPPPPPPPQNQGISPHSAPITPNWTNSFSALVPYTQPNICFSNRKYDATSNPLPTGGYLTTPPPPPIGVHIMVGESHPQNYFCHTSPTTYQSLYYNNHNKRARGKDTDTEVCFRTSNKKKKPLSQIRPRKNDWSILDAKRAVEAEKECHKAARSQSLFIKFPDPELSKEIVSSFHSAIESVHFQQPSAPRFCFVNLSNSADPEQVIKDLNKIRFGEGYIKAELKKDREDDYLFNPENIDPLTLYVGNLAQEVTKDDMMKIYPKTKRIDIGYAKKMKFTRYAFVVFRSVDDSIEAFKKTYATQMHNKSLIVRFRRLNGAVGMSGEIKPQHKTDSEQNKNYTCVEARERQDVSGEVDYDQDEPWNIDVSRWVTNESGTIKTSNCYSDDEYDDVVHKSSLEDLQRDMKDPVKYETPFLTGPLGMEDLPMPKNLDEIKNETDIQCHNLNNQQNENMESGQGLSVIPNVNIDNLFNENVVKVENVSADKKLVLNDNRLYHPGKAISAYNALVHQSPTYIQQHAVTLKKEISSSRNIINKRKQQNTDYSKNNEDACIRNLSQEDSDSSLGQLQRDVKVPVQYKTQFLTGPVEMEHFPMPKKLDEIKKETDIQYHNHNKQQKEGAKHNKDDCTRNLCQEDSESKSQTKNIITKEANFLPLQKTFTKPDDANCNHKSPSMTSVDNKKDPDPGTKKTKSTYEELREISQRIVVDRIQATVKKENEHKDNVLPSATAIIDTIMDPTNCSPKQTSPCLSIHENHGDKNANEINSEVNGSRGALDLDYNTNLQQNKSTHCENEKIEGDKQYITEMDLDFSLENTLSIKPEPNFEDELSNDGDTDDEDDDNRFSDFFNSHRAH